MEVFFTFLGLFLLWKFINFLLKRAQDPNFLKRLNEIESYDDEEEYDGIEENCEYIIQYRRNGSWINGPSSNSESVAESMFDRFLQNDPRSNNKCRLVKKVHGKVVFILMSN